MANKKKVIVTGFEPFGKHAVNSSWVAVQELERLGLGEAVDLHVCEVPVEYHAVQGLLPSLWKEHQPQLMVHVGVSGLATTVTLEQCGHNKGYKRLDNCSFCPASQCCMDSGPDCIHSVLDMDAVCERVNDSDLGVTISVSKDAGRRDLGRALQAAIQEMLKLLELDHTHNKHCNHQLQRQHEHC
ncbi:pyroglutamyl-peptidase 1 isoform X2 [Clinocottus analis]|uniref:pyroglutamyl-peptidase 1 isoform X2 n=1 Tax=Clinocottus analis TaxID=304258 RepID=UPI0035C20218